MGVWKLGDEKMKGGDGGILCWEGGVCVGKVYGRSSPL